MPFPSRHLLVAASLLSACFVPNAAARPRSREDGATPDEVIRDRAPPQPPASSAILQMAFVAAPAEEYFPGDFALPVPILWPRSGSPPKAGALRHTSSYLWRVRIRGPPRPRCARRPLGARNLKPGAAHAELLFSFSQARLRGR